jgi:hypothetical protein
MKKYGRILAVIAVIGLIGFIYYYIALPPVNIHSAGFWFFCIGAVAVLLGIYAVTHIGSMNRVIIKSGLGIIAGLIVIYGIGALLSSPVVNAKKYQRILTVSERSFTEDIEEISYDKIPILDKDSASRLGNRKMGSMVDMVSQFEVSDLYTQINYREKPVRVTPLNYASTVKWLTNSREGIPAYMKIDMATQEVECVKLENGMKYSVFEHFGRNLYRHLRFRYPTYIFDSVNFEIDEEGTPYWICPVKKYTIGLFGGVTIGKVVLVNAVTGDMMEYDIGDVPRWVDRVYSAEMLIDYYDYYGSLKHGFFNSVLGQKDCLKTTEGYNYIALEDDVWVYTGVTSVSSDESNVGFVLMNQRTMETRYYTVSGAEEFSAMASAEGQVQEKGYSATFPLLLNVANKPTYLIALKDAAGLVKQYAMVNIEQYQIVAIGDSVSECEKEYIKLLSSNGIEGEINSSSAEEITGKIAKISEAVIEGNSHYYLMLEGSGEIYDVKVADHINIVTYSVGDKISLQYVKEEEFNQLFDVK